MLKQALFSFGAAGLLALGACSNANDGVALTDAEREAWSSAFAEPAAHALQIRMYEQGRTLGDAAVRFDALHEMLAREPGNAAVQDSLASLYFASRMFGPASQLIGGLVEANPQDARYLEMQAVSHNGLGLVEEALGDYERLLAVDPNPYYAYQIATLQYSLNRFDVAEASVDNMLAGDLDGQLVNINTADGRAQAVPMKAALLNIKGVLRKDVHADYTEAEKYFQLAMAQAPEFNLAKNNLTLLRRQAEAAN